MSAKEQTSPRSRLPFSAEKLQQSGAVKSEDSVSNYL
jgi:hypothetical protein